jgi:hypothetical protein
VDAGVGGHAHRSSHGHGVASVCMSASAIASS